VFTVGAQFAYWRDYLRQRRLGMVLRYHVAMPLVTRLLGYFPAKRLGWMEDTPQGVVRDWTRRAARFEDTYRRGSRRLDAAQRRALAGRFAALRAPTLALSLDDDEFGTVAAVQRLLRHYDNSPSTHVHIAPAAIGVAQIGHFAFFHDRFRGSLWPIALEWLREARLAHAVRGHVVAAP
jgi:predicted alpha/beta hydrolase